MNTQQDRQDHEYPFFFYGSLRSGEYNNRAASRGSGMQLVRTEDRVSGYRLLGRGAFPAAIPTEDLDSSVVVDVFTFTRNDNGRRLFESIERMEVGAGYHRVAATTQSGLVGWIYVMHPAQGSKYFGQEVPNGDWSEFLKSRREDTRA